MHVFQYAGFSCASSSSVSSRMRFMVACTSQFRPFAGCRRISCTERRSDLRFSCHFHLDFAYCVDIRFATVASGSGSGVLVCQALQLLLHGLHCGSRRLRSSLDGYALDQSRMPGTIPCTVFAPDGVPKEYGLVMSDPVSDDAVRWKNERLLFHSMMDLRTAMLFMMNPVLDEESRLEMYSRNFLSV